MTSGKNVLNDLCVGFGLDLTWYLSVRVLGKVDLVSGSHDLVSDVLKNRGSANSRLYR